MCLYNRMFFAFLITYARVYGLPYIHALIRENMRILTSFVCIIHNAASILINKNAEETSIFYLVAHDGRHGRICVNIRTIFDDVMTWKLFPNYWTFVRGPPVTGGFRSQMANNAALSVFVSYIHDWRKSVGSIKNPFLVI